MTFLIGVLLGEGSRKFFFLRRRRKAEEEAGDVVFYHYSLTYSVPALSPLVTQRISFGAVFAYVFMQVWGLAS